MRVSQPNSESMAVKNKATKTLNPRQSQATDLNELKHDIKTQPQPKNAESLKRLSKYLNVQQESNQVPVAGQKSSQFPFAQQPSSKTPLAEQESSRNVPLIPKRSNQVPFPTQGSKNVSGPQQKSVKVPLAPQVSADSDQNSKTLSPVPQEMNSSRQQNFAKPRMSMDLYRNAGKPTDQTQKLSKSLNSLNSHQAYATSQNAFQRSSHHAFQGNPQTTIPGNTKSAISGNSKSYQMTSTKPTISARDKQAIDQARALAMATDFPKMAMRNKIQNNRRAVQLYEEIRRWWLFWLNSDWCSRLNKVCCFINCLIPSCQLQNIVVGNISVLTTCKINYFPSKFQV